MEPCTVYAYVFSPLYKYQIQVSALHCFFWGVELSFKFFLYYCLFCTNVDHVRLYAF
jgi:hypothetical protein